MAVRTSANGDPRRPLFMGGMLRDKRGGRGDGTSLIHFFASGGGGQMNSRFLMTLQVAVVGPQKIGAVPHGTRVTAPIASGHFEGPRLRGRVLPGGGDWTLLRADGVLELDLRVTLETDDGALIHMTSVGLRDEHSPGAPDFGPVPRVQPAEPKFPFLNQ